MNREVQLRPSSGARRTTDRSGALAAFLSFLFPGLGQAYLGRRRSALTFGLPVAVVLVGLLIAFSGRGAAFRAADPTVAFWLIVLVVAVGVWWVAAIIDAWLTGRHSGSPALAVVVLLVLAIGSGSAFASVQLWRVRNAVLEMTSVAGDPTLVSSTPTPSGATAQPNANGSPGASPTRAPDYVDPSDEPGNEPSPSIIPGPTPGIDITAIDAQNDGLLNVLIVGTDQGLPGHVGARTDTIVVASVNSATGDVLMFSFPRDLQDLPIYNGGTFNGKINTFAGATKLYPEQFPNPGLPSLAYEVGFLLGVPIDYYASVNVEGFMRVVDAVGGSVTVCNKRQISDDGLQFYLSPGAHQLDAADALRYARSRHGEAGGDFARAKRQQELLVAIKKEILEPQNLARLPDVVEALAGVVNTNYPPDQIQSLIDLAQQVQDEPSLSWVFKNPQWADFMTRAETGGRQVLTPRLDRIGQLSVFLFGEKSLYYGLVPMPSPGDLPSPDATEPPDTSACTAQT